MRLSLLVFSILFSCAQLSWAATPKNNNSYRPIIGWLENVKLEDANVTLKARIDTGAGLASLHADIIDIKKSKDGKTESVVFSVQQDDGKKVVLERPIEDWINIKKKGDKGYIKRPVVKLLMCLGGKQVRARVNLADRSGFLYPMLIGRNVLKAGDYMIDPQVTYTHEPPCK